MPSRRAAPTPSGGRSMTCRRRSPAACDGALARRVGAAVEDEDDLVGVARDPALRGQRADAAPDERLLVARRHGDDGAQRAHRALLQPPPRRLVGVVVAQGEHADLSAVAQVAHDEVRVALGLHARLVEAVAPRGVLERVVADRGPEPGRGRPRGVLAGERAPGDLAVGQRVAPVLDAQAPARRARAAAAAMSPTASTAGSELRIEASTSTAPSSTSRPASRRQLDARGDAGAEHHEVGRQRLAAGQAHAPARLDALDLGAQADLDAGLAQQRGDELAGALAQALRPAGAPRARRATTSTPRRTSDAAASQAMKPAPTTTARAPGAPRRAGAGRRRRCGSCAGRDPRRPSTGGRCGAEPVASTQAS